MNALERGYADPRWGGYRQIQEAGGPEARLDDGLRPTMGSCRVGGRRALSAEVPGQGDIQACRRTRHGRRTQSAGGTGSSPGILTAIRHPLDPSSRDLRFLVDVLHDRAYEFLRPGRGARLRDPGRGRTQAVSSAEALVLVAALEPLLLHPYSDRALHRDTRNAQEAFPQGKTLGERPRNRGRSPSERSTLSVQNAPSDHLLDNSVFPG